MTRFAWKIAVALTFIVTLVTVATYSKMPERVPIHWNIRGEIDGYGPKLWAFFGPIGMVAMLVLFWAIPLLSPKKYEIEKFQATYDHVTLIVVAMFAYIHMLLVLAFLGIYLNNARALVGGIFFFFALMGNVMGKVRRNYYVGVRTPWTLASERVWNDTHRVAAWAFVGAGLLGCLTAMVNLPLWLPIVILLPAAFGPIIYSFVLYKKLERRGELGE